MTRTLFQRGTVGPLNHLDAQADSRNFQGSQGAVAVVAVRSYAGKAHGRSVVGLGGVAESFRRCRRIGSRS